MLTHLRIENFKLWRDTRGIRLAPITVFFGGNSSGKSSIQQFLLMLKQTAASADRARVLHTGDSGTPVDLGDFVDLIHHHDPKLPLRFELAWRQSKDLHIEDVLAGSPATSSRDLRFAGEIAQADDRGGQVRVTNMSYSVEADDHYLRAGMAAHPRRRGWYDLSFENFVEVRNKGRAWELPAPTRFYGFPDEAVGYYQNTAFLPDLSLALERQLDAITYLGPLRRHPERFYLWSGATPEHVGWRGERTIEALLAGRERTYNFRPKQRLRPLEAVVARWMKQLELIDDFSVTPIARGRPHQEVRVRARGGRDSVLITDVGFGISQVLPVLVQSLYAEPEATIIFEQPELHLHPRVQMELADVFIEAVNAREDSVPRNTQVIIESHSEHFLRRLQRRIAEQELSPNMVALYFCDLVNGEGRLTELDVDLFGNIVNWPRDFFGDQMEDVAAQAQARLRRQVDQSHG